MERPVLADIELRVLGVLIEKALTTPGSYPLTVNSIVLGCNQLQNRDPISQYPDLAVSAAIRILTHKKLVAQAPPSANARSNRFEHRVAESLGWDRRDQAVMAELMLRGRQTAGELRSRASRMSDLPDLPALQAVIDSLSNRAHPFLVELAREPGRSTNRFTHLLGSAVGDDAAPPAGSRESPIAAPTSAVSSQSHDRGANSTEPANWQKLTDERLANLEARLARLERGQESL